jgi:uncharacterized membrane protein (DUF485 family)
LLGALVIIVAFALTGIYVRATNRLDNELAKKREEQRP